MALSAAERKRRQRERQAQERAAQLDAVVPYLRKPFFEYLKEHESGWFNVEFNFAHMGIEAPEFVDDSGPVPPEGAGEMDIFRGRDGSIGRAEVMIEHMLDAAIELAQLVNDYKSEAVSNRMSELVKADLGNEPQKRAAIEEAVKLEELRKRLQRKYRLNIPSWSVRGEQMPD